MKWIGYTGQPTRDPFRRVDPPIKVKVDLVALFPRPPHWQGHYTPLGMQLQKVVDGALTCWGLCEQGMWWALVTYDIAFGAQKRPVTHWVPAWVVKPVAVDRK